MSKSSREWVDECSKQADEDMAKLQAKGIGPGHWGLRGSSHWCDIVVMGGNKAISVWGDIEACTFAYCSGASAPWDVIKWMANADPHYYGKQKARIGMGNVGIDDYIDEVALYDLEIRYQEAKAEYGELWTKPRRRQRTRSVVYADAFYRAVQAVKCGDNIEHVHDRLYDDLKNEEDDVWEWVYEIGKATSVRVIYALAAIRRLYATAE
jgi:hypothetical protein